jgi:hypothetical protein
MTDLGVTKKQSPNLQKLAALAELRRDARRD